MRCKGWGNDVHHKTYARVGGGELMEDFEILCRECHEAHHRAARAAGRRRKRRGIHRRAIFPALTKKMKQKLCADFQVPEKELFAAINYGSNDLICLDAIRMLGMDYVFGRPRGSKKIHNRRCDRWLRI